MKSLNGASGKQNDKALKNIPWGIFRIFRLHGYGGVNNIFPNDLPRICVWPAGLDWCEPAIRD